MKIFFSRRFWLYTASIVLGILCGLSGISFLIGLGNFCAEAFIRIFKCVSMPLIFLSVIMAFLAFERNQKSSKIVKKTLLYTVGTTVVAACVSAVLYCVIRPGNVISLPRNQEIHRAGKGYWQYVIDVIPDGIFSAFSNHKALSVLLIGVVFGATIKFIKDERAKQVIISFFTGIHSMLFTATHHMVKVLPIGLFGFVTVSVVQANGDMNIGEMGKYFSVIVLSNIVQGLVVLPLWLYLERINPMKIFKGMLPALATAFFCKSSAGALPVTLDCAENRLKIDKSTGNFVIPLCTTVNMNGCAAFIFTTVTYLMQNNGVAISIPFVLTCICVATVAAIGNASVPMGCFFMSASLLSAMDIPISLMGIILPFYSIIDMIESALNVWSDSCVATVIDREMKKI
ncbi:MAG: dicarboxylate/amino acid:cation symporter [Puniceicoccales bacterium]|nr:dicarboxylate/amino acid:cation symporter [Puniceicoccales bacterium]